MAEDRVSPNREGGSPNNPKNGLVTPKSPPLHPPHGFAPKMLIL